MHDAALEARKDSSYFTMEHINKLQEMTLEDGKKMLFKVVKESNARDKNKASATAMIHKAQDVGHLMIAATNFMLACEGLSTGRGA